MTTTTGGIIKELWERMRPRPVDAREWFLLRFLFAALVAWMALDRQPFAFPTNPNPVGIAHWIPLTFLARPGMYQAQWYVLVPALVLYVAGWWQPLALTVLALVHTIEWTHVNSQGFNKHSTQVVTVVLCTQALVAWLHALRSRRGAGSIGIWRVGLPGVQVYYTVAMLAATYVLAAVAKILNSKGLWAWNAPYLSVDLVKSARQAWYSTLDPEFAGHVAAADWLIAHPWLARAGFAGVLVLELVAFLALCGRTWAFWFGVGLIAMHLGIEWVMHLDFFYNELVLAVFYVNPAGWALLAWDQWRAAGKTGGPRAS